MAGGTSTGDEMVPFAIIDRYSPCISSSGVVRGELKDGRWWIGLISGRPPVGMTKSSIVVLFAGFSLIAASVFLEQDGAALWPSVFTGAFGTSVQLTLLYDPSAVALITCLLLTTVVYTYQLSVADSFFNGTGYEATGGLLRRAYSDQPIEIQDKIKREIKTFNGWIGFLSRWWFSSVSFIALLFLVLWAKAAMVGHGPLPGLTSIPEGVRLEHWWASSEVAWFYFFWVAYSLTVTVKQMLFFAACMRLLKKSLELMDDPLQLNAMHPDGSSGVGYLRQALVSILTSAFLHWVAALIALFVWFDFGHLTLALALTLTTLSIAVFAAPIAISRKAISYAKREKAGQLVARKELVESNIRDLVSGADRALREAWKDSATTPSSDTVSLAELVVEAELKRLDRITEELQSVLRVPTLGFNVWNLALGAASYLVAPIILLIVESFTS